MYPIANGEYTIAIETFFNDYELHEKAVIYIEGVSVYIQSYNTKKYSLDAGKDSHVWIYYTTTIFNFKKGGSSPSQLYYTVYIDKEGSDLQTYPERYVGMYAQLVTVLQVITTMLTVKFMMRTKLMRLIKLK